MDKQLTITELKAELNKICSKYKLRIDEEYYEILPQDSTILPENFPYSAGDFTIKRGEGIDFGNDWDSYEDDWYYADDTGIFYKGKLLAKPARNLLLTDYCVILVNEMSQDETLIKVLDADLEISKAIGEKYEDDYDKGFSFFGGKVNYYFIDIKYNIIRKISNMLNGVNGFLGLKELERIDNRIEGWEKEIKRKNFYIQQEQKSIKRLQEEIKRTEEEIKIIEEEEIKRLKNIKQNYAK